MTFTGTGRQDDQCCQIVNEELRNILRMVSHVLNISTTGRYLLFCLHYSLNKINYLNKIAGAGLEPMTVWSRANMLANDQEITFRDISANVKY